jgi:hypothetical protein
MENRREHLDNTALRTLYEQKMQELSTALLEGASWEQVREQRFLLVELSRRLNRAGIQQSPAEHTTRNHQPPTP